MNHVGVRRDGEGAASLVPGWLVCCILLALVVLMAPVAASLARPVFVLGCVGLGWYAWRQGPAAHLQSMLVLFAFAPFARRVVDLYAGVDLGGMMLVGPLLAILVPVPRLIAFLDGRSHWLRNGLAPITVVLCCVGYAACLSLFQGAFMDASAGALKWVAPLLYAAVLVETADRAGAMQAATSAFALILPVAGIYGAFQYIDPPQWDTYWMQFAPVTAGLPLPYEVRVFSTLNSPASFATFTAAGLLLVCYLRPLWFACLVSAPATLAFLLSQYRTAWLSLAVGILFCLLLARTRARSGVIILAMAGAGLVALTMPPFNEVVLERLQTLGDGGQDGSARERMQEFVTLWNKPDSSMVGVGFTTTDPGVAGTMPVDGMIVACWLMMGIVVGVICLSAFIWASGRMIANAVASGRSDAVVLGGLGCGAMVQMPLASLASGELGFLFWTFAALACLPDEPEGKPIEW